MRITVLRIGHRIERDKRLTTHCALAARALGAKEFVYTGERDKRFEATVAAVVRNWGGAFPVRYSASWEKELRAAKRRKQAIVHLTMYGLPFEDALVEVKKKKRLLVVVGGEKIRGGVYAEADYNLGVTNQPHSEAGALAVFLHALGLRPGFAGWRIRVLPVERGKRVKQRKI